MEPGQAFTLHDLDPLANRRVRRSDEEPLALLAEYEQAVSQRKGKDWLREHAVHPAQVSQWRRLRETSELPAGDPLLAGAASSSLSLAQKAVLDREYQDAVSHGQGQQWLEERNLTGTGIHRWLIEVIAAMGDGTAADGGQSQPETGALWPRVAVDEAGMDTADVGPSHREAVLDDHVPQQGSAPQQGSFVPPGWDFFPPRWDGDFGYSPLESTEMSPTIDEILRGLEDVPCHDTAPPNDLPSEAPTESDSRLTWIGPTAADRSETIDEAWQQQRMISPEPEAITDPVAAAATGSMLTGQASDADHSPAPAAHPETDQGSGAG